MQIFCAFPKKKKIVAFNDLSGGFALLQRLMHVKAAFPGLISYDLIENVILFPEDVHPSQSLLETT